MFRGNRVGIPRMEFVSGTPSMLQVTAHFINNEAQTLHGSIKHDFPLDNELDPELMRLLAPLVRLIESRVYAKHFTDAVEPQQEVTRGIAEATNRTTDDPGRQG